MNDNIASQVYHVLDKYDKGYSCSGVMANLEQWQHNKGWLVELLRKHPNWNEDALAIVFEVTQSREIDRHTVNGYKYDLVRLTDEQGLEAGDRDKFLRSLDAVAYTYTNRIPDTDIATRVKDSSGVACVAGQKSSRVINAICVRYGLNKHPEYNARFARLADALNPIQIKRTALLSVHPCDYLEMSNRENSWSSCHCLDDGEYHGGVLSYMNDNCTMIFYTVDDGVTEDYYTAPKRTRQVFCYQDGILLQSRLYPQTDDNDTRETYRNIVQSTITDCMSAPNLWTLKREHESVIHRARTHDDALQYPDYEYKQFKANVSLLKDAGVEDYDYLIIGTTAYCLDCASTISENNCLYCDSCHDDGYVNCYDCDHQVYEDDAYSIDGYWYCNDCCFYCEHCEEQRRSDSTEVYNRRGHRIQVCECCRDDDYYYCEGCDDYYHENNGHHLDNGYCCETCFDNNYYACDDCGEPVYITDVEVVEYGNYCRDCADSKKYELEADTEYTEYLESA